MEKVFVDGIELFDLKSETTVEELRKELRMIDSPFAAIRAVDTNGRETIYLQHHSEKNIAFLRKMIKSSGSEVERVLGSSKKSDLFEYFSGKGFFTITSLSTGTYIANPRAINFLKTWDKYHRYRKTGSHIAK